MIPAVEFTDSATPALLKLDHAVNGPELKEALSRELEAAMIENFVSLGSHPRKDGGAPVFFAQAAKSVSAKVESDGVTVSCDLPGIRQRYYGGKIAPKHLYMAIAARPEAANRPPSSGLTFGYEINPENNALMPCLIEGLVKGFDFPGTVMYWLIRQADQEPDPRVLPSPEKLQAVAAKALEGLKI